MRRIVPMMGRQFSDHQFSCCTTDGCPVLLFIPRSVSNMLIRRIEILWRIWLLVKISDSAEIGDG
ncbi:hypothetical protein [Nocardia sp. NPDC059229]|uniref:hypothetical protein n=1 Tax=Nocardia sp. NPDC059229 TaxID=3346778 RepID=UPI0036833648